MIPLQLPYHLIDQLQNQRGMEQRQRQPNKLRHYLSETSAEMEQPRPTRSNRGKRTRDSLHKGGEFIGRNPRTVQEEDPKMEVEEKEEEGIGIREEGEGNEEDVGIPTTNVSKHHQFKHPT